MSVGYDDAGNLIGEFDPSGSGMGAQYSNNAGSGGFQFPDLSGLFNSLSNGIWNSQHPQTVTTSNHALIYLAIAGGIIILAVLATKKK